MRSSLIVLEGIDGAGKATQLKLLAERFRKEGHTVTVFSFPRYDLSAGKIIKESLHGMHGNFLALDPYLKAFPYSFDRARAAPAIKAALKKGIVMCDRYTPSNLAFGGAQLRPSEREKFFAFVEQLEYKESGVPKPDVIVYLDTPVAAARTMLRGEGKKLDQNERAAAFQARVRGTYKQLAERTGWHTVRCGAGTIQRSKEDIHEEVWRILHRKIARR